MFYSLFSQQAAIHPHKVAVVCNGSQTTYGEMAISIDQAAHNLLAMGVTQGEVFGVCFDSSVEYLVLYYALARLGARVVPFTTSMAPHEIEAFCRECEPDYFVVHSAYEDKFSTIVEKLGKGCLISEGSTPHNLQSIFQEGANPSATLPNAEWADQDFVVHYNTPNSPEPGQRFKGAVQTHATHANRMLNWAQAAAITSDDRTLCMHPLMHAFGSEMFALPALSTGQTLYLMTAQEVTPANVAKAIQEGRITLFGALPWFYHELTELPAETRADLSTLRIAMCAATPLQANVAERFFALYGKRVSNSYGLTETSLIASNLDGEGMEDMLTVGREISNVEAKLRDCGIDMPGVGELLVRSNGFATRYFSEDVPALWQDGWIYTGDLARRSNTGSFYILGRVSQVIRTAKGSFLPWEVEEAIACHPGVKEVAVVPAVGEAGVQLAAFIVTYEQVTEKDLRQYLAQTLGEHKAPPVIQFRDALPKSATGKISRAKLRIEEDF